ncbi:MAG: uroporphyrinogen-III synthase [Methyloceanibacter sp.]|uniref:uroporphyrinogen-III synthase n=1 Tax=Methyloceanibacter sp. TaxID=1965321 RepID=UPI003D6DA5A6
MLVTRPEPDARHEAEALAARGHDPVLAPLLEIEFLPDVDFSLEGAQALIVTSRNALRALAAHDALDEAIALPLFAVGETTAREAKALGFAEVTIGPGTAAGLAPLIRREVHPEKGALVHLAGEALAFDLKPVLEEEGFDVRIVVLYRTHPLPELPGNVLEDLANGAMGGVILLSPRTAKTFARLLQGQGAVTQAKSPVCYCLSQAVAEAVAPLGFDVRVPAHPREEDVLALLDSGAPSS